MIRGRVKRASVLGASMAEQPRATQSNRPPLMIRRLRGVADASDTASLIDPLAP